MRWMPAIFSLLVAVAAIASICAGVMGLLSWWGAYLDPVTMSDLIMAIGFSVDYTAHISYHFYATGTGMTDVQFVYAEMPDQFSLRQHVVQ